MREKMSRQEDQRSKEVRKGNPSGGQETDPRTLAGRMQIEIQRQVQQNRSQQGKQNSESRSRKNVRNR